MHCLAVIYGSISISHTNALLLVTLLVLVVFIGGISLLCRHSEKRNEEKARKKFHDLLPRYRERLAKVLEDAHDPHVPEMSRASIRDWISRLNDIERWSKEPGIQWEDLYENHLKVIKIPLEMWEECIGDIKRAYAEGPQLLHDVIEQVNDLQATGKLTGQILETVRLDLEEALSGARQADPNWIAICSLIAEIHEKLSAANLSDAPPQL